MTTPDAVGRAPDSMSGSPGSRAAVTVVILTRNEEVNLPSALRSVVGWAHEAVVLDSMSTDATESVARAGGARFLTREFDNYSAQRNFALREVPIATDWVLFLDADEWLPDALKAEIAEVVNSAPNEDGFLVKYRLIWLGHWVRHGYYPTWLLRLVRRSAARCESREVNEHIVVEGAVGRLRHDFIHEDRKPLSEWIAKHNTYAGREARLLLEAEQQAGRLEASLTGTQAERKRWVRARVWNRLPPLLRPLLYFFYRYFLRGGFLDGRAGLVFHFLQGLWYPFLIDAKYLELRMKGGTK
jgi:glycosyltransferase involved in cell wall biosynthesis